MDIYNIDNCIRRAARMYEMEVPDTDIHEFVVTSESEDLTFLIMQAAKILAKE